MDQNWKWFVPLLSLLVLLCLGGFFVGGLALMKSSDAYSGAVARAKASPAVLTALGSPIKDGLFFAGNIKENNSSGSANLAIPISGPKGTAKLYVSASRSSGQWHFDNLIVLVDKTEQRIDLSDTNQPP
jgi:hypothetical protein